MKYVQLTQTNGFPIYVCIDHIIYLSDQSDGSILSLSNHEFLSIKEEVSFVIDLIDSVLSQIESNRKKD